MGAKARSYPPRHNNEVGRRLGRAFPAAHARTNRNTRETPPTTCIIMRARAVLAVLLLAVCASVASASTRNLQFSIYFPGQGLTISAANFLPFYTEAVTEGLTDGPLEGFSSYLDYGLEGILSQSVANLGQLGVGAASGGADYLTIG